MFIFPLLASSGEQRIVIGNGGQVSTNFHTVVLESHWSARCRCRGDAKMIHRHLLQTCTSGFHIPMVKSSLSPRQRSNISRRTSSGRISIVTCPAIHRTSQHSCWTQQLSRPTLILCIIGGFFLVVRESLSHQGAFGRVNLSPKTWMHLEIDTWLGMAKEITSRWQIGLREGLYQAFVSKSGNGNDGSSWTYPCLRGLTGVSEGPQEYWMDQ